MTLVTNRTIALDVDNVLADTAGAFCERASELWGRKVTKEEITDAMVVGSFRVPPREILDILQDVWEDWPSLQPLENDSAETILDLRKSGYRIIIATSRPRTSLPNVKSWLESRRIEYDGFVHFERGTKNAVNAEVLVDDDQATVVDFVVKFGGKRIGLLYDQPWNREVLPFEGVHRIDHLKEILDFV